LLSFCLAPHSPYTVSDRSFERIATLSAQLDLAVHMHVQETVAEVDESLARYGLRPLARLQRLGLLDPHLIAVHAVHLTGDEIELLAEHDCSVAHCPTSNLKLASGIAPVARLLAAGVRVGLGTDGAASNNRLDLLREMRQCALLAKATSGDASVIDCHRALRLSTLDGARVLGLGDRLGSLVPGKLADLCAIRLDDWIEQPCLDPACQIVHVAGREQVANVWVGGRIRIREGLPADDAAIALHDIGHSWHNKICG
ncbi:MAG TPA: amidohydrolase family protein, partial [Rhodocyclaceae bacterium]|nr:amidohydrolase family protein [Rhodocyclaceae bacterium]